MTRKKPEATASRLGGLALGALKQVVNGKAGDLIEAVLKPRHARPLQAGGQVRLVDMAARRLGSRCYLVLAWYGDRTSWTRNPCSSAFAW
jgi:hypothetical protein